MTTIVTRSGKGSSLTHAEVDANFTNLNADKLELAGGTMSGSLVLNADPTAGLQAATKQYVDTTTATAAQGALADSATQPEDLATVATSGSYSDLTGAPTLYDDSDVDTHLNTGTATSGQVLSWTGSDYDWLDAVGGGGMFKGDNGTVGSRAGDIFRINEQTLNTSTTIDADENASATGPLAVASGVTLTVTAGGNLSIV
jgi:hypothetical protein